jgi:hypothetical protein
MPRCATRPSTTSRCTAPERGGVSVGRVLARAAAFLLFVAVAVFPFAHAQHGGSHPSAPHASAPHMSAPHMSSPSRPAFRGPAYGGSPYRGSAPRMAPTYRGFPPGYAGRPAPPGHPLPYPGVAPNRYAPVPRPAYGPGMPYGAAPRGPYGAPTANVRGPHLGSWLQSHQGQSFAGQENALRQEPGFDRLPQQQQQRLINRLHQLNAMPPDQRQRTISRNENFERLDPQQRQAFLGSAQDLRTMDPARKQQVRSAYRVLRDMPPEQREHVLNSPAYRSMYSDHERDVLGNLLSVEPYTPR